MKTILITGATSGIGFEASVQLPTHQPKACAALGQDEGLAEQLWAKSAELVKL